MDTITLISLGLNLFLAGWTLAKMNSTDIGLVEDYRNQKKEMWKRIQEGLK
jgi:hypothetical protein